MMEQGLNESAQDAQQPDEYCQVSHAAKAPNRHKALAHTKAMLRRIHAAHCSGKRKLCDHLAHIYLNSMDARYTATRLAYTHLKPHERPDPGCLFAIAQAVDPWNCTDEDVYLRFQQKKGNPDKCRPILEFGIENRARQYLVLPLLRARSERHPCQYGRRGTQAAIARVAQLMARGYVWGIETDIADCFPSFDGEKVADQLPIPKRVTSAVVVGAPL
jgi:hypothetical protein